MTRALWDRMDTIERFAADVSHEIKNPLTSLRSAVETAFLVKGREGDLERLLHIMQHDVTRLDRLISDISNASRLDAELSREEMGLFAPAKLLKPLVDAHRVTLEREQSKLPPDPTRLPPEKKLLLVLPEGDLSNDDLVRGNEHRLAQVFANLLTNALSFTPPEGAVTLEVKPEPHNQRTLFTVSDEGPGIPDNKLENIFERFYSQRPKHEGYGRHSGLGLSIARQIIKAHDGVIYAENIRNQDGSIKGARFTVVLNNADAKLK
jgi:two-component system sensor histidine kinase ChvG